MCGYEQPRREAVPQLSHTTGAATLDAADLRRADDSVGSGGGPLSAETLLLLAAQADLRSAIESNGREIAALRTRLFKGESA